LTQDEQFSNPFDKVARGDGGKTHCEIVERPTPEASMKFICGKAQKLEGYRTHIYICIHIHLPVVQGLDAPNVKDCRHGPSMKPIPK
jgi:hypothetical protein